MITCSFCFRTLPPNAFVHNNKTYKTCARCKTNRAKKKNSKQSIVVDNNKQNYYRLERRIEKLQEKVDIHLEQKVSAKQTYD